ncbi:MAG: hypothetical protein VB124_04440 [Burkholderia sp.]
MLDWLLGVNVNRSLARPIYATTPFNNVEEVRAAAAAFKGRYHREWRLEKPVFKTPFEGRQAPLLTLAA